MTRRLLEQFLLSQIAKTFPSAIFYKETTQKIIALTIDDIPARDEDQKDSTRQILKTIKQHNQTFTTDVSATFFITTEHLKYKTNPDHLDLELLTEIIEQGHEISNHGKLDHRHANLAKSNFQSEFIESHQLLSKQINQPINWFRPGQAFYNQSMVEILTTLGKELGYQNKFALASMIPFDTRKLIGNPNFTLKNIEQFTFPGSIIILHGGYKTDAAKTVEVLNQLLPRLYQQDYQVVSLSKLFDMKG
ncbi:MAG: polysaccharide deacetylase family protein [Microcystaceae cyanobacterium]